jgi:hypothetical protein
MFSYGICGITFHSNIPIDELIPGVPGVPEFTFEFCGPAKRHAATYRWLNHWYSFSGAKWLSFAKLDSGYLLRFPAHADFVVTDGARRIFGYTRGACPPETMRHLLLNQVIPIVLSQLGKLVLHASACAAPQGVMAFMGTTGMGKSTLAASFGLRGLAVLTDDCLLVRKQGERVVGVPSYAGLRLWPESVRALFDEQPALQPLAHYTVKKRLLFHQGYTGEPLSLQAVYVLTEPDDVQGERQVDIEPLSASQALFETVRHTFQLDVTDRERLAGAFKRYEWLANAVPFFRLRFPRDHTLLPVVNGAILDHFARLENREPVPAWR